MGKYNAIKDSAKKLSIKENNIYVFGVSGKDTEMIERFENGIAMGNASKDIKKKAKYIIGCNNTD